MLAFWLERAEDFPGTVLPPAFRAVKTGCGIGTAGGYAP